MNHVFLIGRLGSDPELKTTTTGKQVASFSIAVEKKFKPQDGSSDADWFRVSCWEKQAEFVCNYLGKGRLVAVSGRLQQRSYTTQDGQQREVVEIVADEVKGLDRPREDGAAKPATSGAKTTEDYDPWAGE